MTNKITQDSFLDAATNGLLDVVRESLQKQLCDVDWQNERGWTALMKSARHCQKDVANILISHKCNLDLQCNNGWTALMLAAEKGHKDIVDALIAHNSNPYLQNNNGQTAQIIAAYIRVTRMLSRHY